MSARTSQANVQTLSPLQFGQRALLAEMIKRAALAGWLPLEYYDVPTGEIVRGVPLTAARAWREHVARGNRFQLVFHQRRTHEIAPVQFNPFETQLVELIGSSNRDLCEAIERARLT